MADVWQGFAGAMGGAVARLANAQAQERSRCRKLSVVSLWPDGWENLHWQASGSMFACHDGGECHGKGQNIFSHGVAIVGLALCVKGSHACLQTYQTPMPLARILPHVESDAGMGQVALRPVACVDAMAR